VSSAERSAAFEWGFEKGEQSERERIIKLLEEELGEGDWVITLIKGEKK
jgi:hypothetical protein